MGKQQEMYMQFLYPSTNGNQGAFTVNTGTLTLNKNKAKAVINNVNVEGYMDNEKIILDGTGDRGAQGNPLPRYDLERVSPLVWRGECKREESIGMVVHEVVCLISKKPNKLMERRDLEALLKMDAPRGFAALSMNR